MQPVKLSELQDQRRKYRAYIDAALAMGEDEAILLDTITRANAAYGCLRAQIRDLPLIVRVINEKPYLVKKK